MTLETYLKSTDLTRVEKELVVLVMRGHGNKEIGVIRNLTIRSVKNYMTHIYRKMGVDSRYKLMAKCGHINESEVEV